MRDSSAGRQCLGQLARQARTAPPLPFRLVRPTVMDLRFRGDACVLGAPDGKLELCLGNFSLAQWPGLEVDVPHLNGLVDRLRQSRARPSCW